MGQGETPTRLTVAQVRREFGIGRSTIYRYIKQGKLSAVKDRDGTKHLEVAELVRVFGEPKPSTVSSGTSHRDSVGPPATNLVASLEQEVRHLRESVGLLERELADARNRETWLQGLIETRLLPPPQDDAISEIMARLRKREAKKAKKRKGKKK